MKQGKQKIQESKPVISVNQTKTCQDKEMIEFPYIDEVPIDNLQGRHIFIDGGKRTLFQMMMIKGNLVHTLIVKE